MAKIALGNRLQASKPDFIRSVLAELVLTFIFVFTVVFSSITAGRLVGGANSVMGLTAVALTNAMMVATIITVGLDVSAGQLNPAVTIGLAAGGYMTVMQAVFYVIVQLSGSTMACLLLKFLTADPDIPIHSLSSGTAPLQGVMLEIVITFFMVLCNFACVVNPQKAMMSRPGPLYVGFIVGANNFTAAPLTGASMNPARSFGPALVTWNWTNHWIYWVGPLAGSAIASLVYEQIFANKFGMLLPTDEDDIA